MPAPRPKTPDERALETFQKDLVTGDKARARRVQVAAKLINGGMSMDEVAARLTRASRQVGGPDVTYAAVQKMMFRHKQGKA